MRIRWIVVLLFLSVCSWANLPKDDKKKGEDETETVKPIYVEGVIYALPRTGLSVKVFARKTEFVPGPYSKYAKKYIGLDVQSKAQTNWEITGINLETFAEADPEAMYKAMDTIASLLSLLPDGRIAGINTKSTCDKQSLLGKDFVVKKRANNLEFTDLSSDDFYYIVLDSISGEEKLVSKEMELKAREAANYIMKLRQKRAFKILDAFDVVPEDGNGYAVFIKEAQRLEKEYIALFAGKKVASEHEFEFVFIPGSRDLKNEVLFRFSEEKGVLPKSDISGKPVVIEMLKEQVAYTKATKLEDSEDPEAGSLGIYYRVPVNASVELSDGLSTLYYKGRITIAQFGVVAPVPSNLLNGMYRIEYNENTGTLQNISKK